MENLIEIKNVYKSYSNKKITTYALNNLSLTIKKGEVIVILGASGSGKTTLLNIISGLDQVSKGQILYKGKNISKYGDIRITRFRKKHFGFIFQNYNLLENLNVYENVCIGASLGIKKVNVNEIVETVGLFEKKHNYMEQLSGGEKQRVAIAMSLAKSPDVMFCDEPTGALDEITGKVVLDSLIKLNMKTGMTTIIVTHNPGIALIGDRVIKMNSGKIIEIKNNEKRIAAKALPWG